MACCIAYTCALLGIIVPISSAAYIPVRFIIRITNTKLPFWFGAVYRKLFYFPKDFGTVTTRTATTTNLKRH